jgi:2-C-methyl-D-erythritol 4-phosphate cytidylyltransferase
MDDRVWAVVAAAGSGERLGAGVPKALALLAGEPILAHAVRALTAEPRVRGIVVVAPPGREQELAETAASAAHAAPGAEAVEVTAVTGGPTRAGSVANGLVRVPDTARVILVHDAARCLVPVAVVTAVIDEVLAGALAVVPAAPVVDTIRRIVDGSSHVVDRTTLRAVQTPQGFDARALRRAHAAGDPHATDDAGMVESLGLPVTLVPGDPRAFKVTTGQDLALAEALLAADRTGGGS